MTKKEIIDNFTIGTLLTFNRKGGIKRVLQCYFKKTEHKIFESNIKIITELQDIFDIINAYVANDIYSSFNFEIFQDIKTKIMITFYNKIEDLDKYGPLKEYIEFTI